MHVFTYGTLMFPEIWQAVAGRLFPSVAGELKNYAIYRVKNAEFPGIVAAGNHERVRGILYLDVDAAALERLDRFEDTFYERQSLKVDCDDGERRPAHTYVVPEANRAVLTDERWNGDDFVACSGLERFRQRFAGFSRL